MIIRYWYLNLPHPRRKSPDPFDNLVVAEYSDEPGYGIDYTEEEMLELWNERYLPDGALVYSAMRYYPA